MHFSLPLFTGVKKDKNTKVISESEWRISCNVKWLSVVVLLLGLTGLAVLYDVCDWLDINPDIRCDTVGHAIVYVVSTGGRRIMSRRRSRQQKRWMSDRDPLLTAHVFADWTCWRVLRDFNNALSLLWLSELFQCHKPILSGYRRGGKLVSKTNIEKSRLHKVRS